jgi:ATP-dependent RNA helicase RhlE
MTFSELHLNELILDGLSAMGFNDPTPIQQQAIPVILEKKDLIACAQTGTGKTAAYILPTLHHLLDTQSNHIDTIIIAPTRELALQIDQQVEGFAYFVPVSSIPVYGGGEASTWNQQKEALEQGANIVIATPGRLIAHLNLGYVDVNHVKRLILDEADRMLDMGFHDDIIKIVNMLPKERQTLLFSATMPPKIRSLAAKLLKDPVEINIAISKPAAGILQGAFSVYNHQKLPLIIELLKGHEEDLPSIIIFSSTKQNVKVLEKELQKFGLAANAMHSDLDQSEREKVLMNFKNKKTQLLIATDIVARGIDIDSISLVINYDVPQDAEDYIHRVGRTARAASTGIAITLINEEDQYKFHKIETLIGAPIKKASLPAHFEKGPEYDPIKNRGLDKRGRGRGRRPKR